PTGAGGAGRGGNAGASGRGGSGNGAANAQGGSVAAGDTVVPPPGDPDLTGGCNLSARAHTPLGAGYPHAANVALWLLALTLATRRRRS
ncbi:MAG TPA: hypothetical protein VK509_25885, partial [Polyangiales bacterium]|nr:hypothetical protein [Polyangiales bacterium]